MHVPYRPAVCRPLRCRRRAVSTGRLQQVHRQLQPQDALANESSLPSTSPAAGTFSTAQPIVPCTGDTASTTPLLQTLPGRPHAAACGTLSRRTLLSLGGVATADVAGRLLLPHSASAGPAATSTTPPVTAKPGLGFEERVSEFTLSNGMHFIILERHEAPVLSCIVHANVGAFDEAPGSTGMAHLLEHMAFKGSSEVGSKDWRREAPMLEALDEVFYELRNAQDEARRQGSTSKALEAKINRLTSRFKELQEDAAQLSIPNYWPALLQQEGGVGLNATTSQDETRYFVSLPSNKLELWFALESRRFQDPVFRELYSEKRVVAEERQLRLESSPMGKYQQAYVSNALGNNYRRPVIGYAEDVDRMGRREVYDFFRKYYGPSNITVAIVGDVQPEQARRLAETYFGDWNPTRRGDDGSGGGYIRLPSGAELLALSTSEPLPYPVPPPGLPAAGAGKPPSATGVLASGAPNPGWVFREASEAGPFCMLGFYRPPLNTPDGTALKVLVDVLAGSRTSRLVSRLVLGERRLLVASAEPSFTGEKHAGLTLVYGRPLEGRKPEEAEQLLRRELDLLIEQGPDRAELARVKKSSRAGLYGALQSNKGMADALTTYHVLTGSWRGLLTELDAVAELTPEQCRDAAARVFAANNCFRGYMDPLGSGRGGPSTAFTA